MKTYPNFTNDLARFKNQIIRWENEGKRETDPELAEMFAMDAGDLRKVLRHLRKNQFQAAWDTLENLDTLVRDQVPRRLYNFIAQENGYC